MRLTHRTWDLSPSNARLCALCGNGSGGRRGSGVTQRSAGNVLGCLLARKREARQRGMSVPADGKKAHAPVAFEELRGTIVGARWTIGWGYRQ